MTKKNSIAGAILLFMILAVGAAQAEEPEFAALAGPGKKNKIDETAYFTWEFVQKPKMGPAILRLQLFGRDGNRRTDLAISGRTDMPSMKGAHDSGEVPFKLNKKGDYLLPVDIVMPGDWEIRLTFKSGDAVVFRGRIVFDV
jgi:nitrogen fixation protein FixH